MKKVSDVAIITKNQFSSASDFSQHIERLAARTGTPHMDCIIDFCQKEGIDIEVASKLVNKSLKAKIRTEAEDRNLMARKASPKLL